MTFDPLDLEKKLGQCLERLKKDFTTMRAGTANPAILDPVMVKLEGKMVPLRDLAQVSIKDAKTLVVSVSDAELTTPIEKAIREAGLNLNPIADNKAVRVPVPKPTKEFRESLTKLASTAAEKAKTIVRKLRQDGMKDLKKDLKAGMSEDKNYTLEQKAQTLHDKYIKDIEDALKAKTKEIMSN
ncbi:ribosome recycling factor [Dissophora ornata]|nr:ribosome recycling factor [Dissophora ornata]